MRCCRRRSLCRRLLPIIAPRVVVPVEAVQDNAHFLGQRFGPRQAAILLDARHGKQLAGVVIPEPPDDAAEVPGVLLSDRASHENERGLRGEEKGKLGKVTVT